MFSNSWTIDRGCRVRGKRLVQRWSEEVTAQRFAVRSIGDVINGCAAVDTSIGVNAKGNIM
jgi:hypothetical protein